MPKGEAMLATPPTPYGFSRVRLFVRRLLSHAPKLSPVDLQAIVDLFEILRRWRDEAQR